MAEGPSAIDQLSALQAAARDIKPELGIPADMSRRTLADLLVSEGYDLKNNSLEAATRAWQHRNGLSPKGFDDTGAPDIITLALIAAKNDDSRLPKGATMEQVHSLALANLTEAASDRSNGSKLDTVFERAGLGAALSAAAPAQAAPAAAPASPDPLGEFIGGLKGMNEPVTAAPAPAASGPDLGKLGAAAGQKLEQGVGALRDAGGRVWDNVTGAFRDLGDKPAAPAEDPAAAAREAAAKAERDAQLKATADAIARRAEELRRGAGAVVQDATDGLNGVGRFLKGKLDDLTSGGGAAAPAASDPGVAPPAPASTPAAPAARKAGRPQFD